LTTGEIRPFWKPFVLSMAPPPSGVAIFKIHPPFPENNKWECTTSRQLESEW
jgi:hypothetical protein